MPYSVVGILLVVLVQYVSSQECPWCSVNDNRAAEFNQVAVHDFDLSQGQKLRRIDCVVVCSRDIRCRSFRYNPQTEYCYTYGVGYSIFMNILNEMISLESGSRLYIMCGALHSFGTSCSSTADCNFTNAYCLLGSCSCMVGFSYDVWSGNCLEGCSVYGDMFTEYKRVLVDGCKTKTLYKQTYRKCMVACSEEEDFTCINSNLDYFKTCYLCNLTGHSLGAGLRIATGTYDILYYRHCAY